MSSESSRPADATTPRPATSRRQVLAGTGAALASVAFTGAFSELFAGTAAARGHAGYGPLVPDPDGLLDLPKGFRYRVLSREGGPLRSGQGLVPSNHDGMAAFAGRHGHVHLVRNHENRVTARIPVPVVEGLTYDPMGKGGCTALELDGRNNVLGERVAIAGTAVNCAGGRTPWNTWLTCEETEDRAGTNGYTKDHGFIFEVDGADPRRTGAVPLTAMGRFQHEAIAIDPGNGIVYETEDAFDKPFGLFYRFLPNKPLGGTGSLRAGGRLEAMRVPGVPDLSLVQETGTAFEGIEW
ncbi:alkaline phosphatase PhoX, partial [Streptomyces sp. NPDC001274]